MAARVCEMDEVPGWDEEGWVVEQGEAEWERLSVQVGRHFGRGEIRDRALGYAKGLLSPGIERKNGWQMAEALGYADPYGVQYLLGRACWEADAVRDEVRGYVVEHLGEPAAVLVVDETGFLKKGQYSVGVQRQYTGTAGKVENCQVGVFLGYASSHGHALLDRELYLPKSWTDDTIRCVVAGVPQEREFATKPELARQMLERALEAGVPAAWVTGDEVYGGNRELRGWLERRQQAYVMAVASNEALGLDEGQVITTVVGMRLPATAWQCHSAGRGTKGPRLYDWAYVPLAEPAAAGWQAGLLLRRSLSDPQEIAYYRVFAPTGTALATLVRVAGCRWTIETGFEEAKGNVGLDHYEVRSWSGWYRHITLAMLAHAFLAVTGTRVSRDDEKKTVPMRPFSSPARPSSSA